MSDETRSRLAAEAGYTGEAATVFADLLAGETDEELSAHAAKVSGVLASVPAPFVQNATDPSQGHGMPNEPDAAKWFTKRVDASLLRPRDPWGRIDA